METNKDLKYFTLISMLFVSCLIISNTVATKIIVFWGFNAPAGIILFPLSYLINDVMTEVYGFKRTKKVIWAGFICLALMSLTYEISIRLTPAPFWQDQQSFATSFSLVPRIVFAGLVAYLMGTFLNSIVMSLLKKRTQGKHLWVRTIGSTIAGEGIDSLIFYIIAFYGVFGLSDIFYIAFSSFLLKVGYEVIGTPLTYLVVNKLKKVESIDTFDYNTSYNPF